LRHGLGRQTRGAGFFVEAMHEPDLADDEWFRAVRGILAQMETEGAEGDFQEREPDPDFGCSLSFSGP
jgi:hypothetical protein